MSIPRLILGVFFAIVAGVAVLRRRPQPGIGPITVVAPASPSKPSDWALVWVGVATVIAGIGVAVLQLQILNQQTEIARVQTELMRAEYLPVFHVSLEAVPDPDSPGQWREQLTISNSGGQARNFIAQPMVFFEVYRRSEGDSNSPSIFLPILDYYGSREETSGGNMRNTQGQMGTWFGAVGEPFDGRAPPPLRTNARDLAFEVQGLINDRTGEDNWYVTVATYINVYYEDIVSDGGDRAGTREVYWVNELAFFEDSGRLWLMDRWNPIDSDEYENLDFDSFIRLGVTTPDQVYELWREEATRNGN